ncbi:PLP-dependent transferase [Arcanobacterium haemolyticum]|nr:PLP-dependent transferase [Arcanobacterium haemolyticum]
MTGFATRAVHVGQEPDPITGDVVPPVHVTSTYVMDSVGEARAGYDYSRSGNPTRSAYERALASLEGGAGALAFPAGLSAEDTLVRAVTRIGGHISFGADVYGGTYRLFTSVLPREGRTATALDLTDLEAVEHDLATHPAHVLWVETPSNPRLHVFDIRALAALAHSYGALLVVDNTFASPVLQRPLELGADVVVHSTTKYIGGHSDIIGGAIITAKDVVVPADVTGWSESGRVLDEVHYLQNATGAVPSPRDCYLAHRGLKTLAVRVSRQSETALAIAHFLENDDRVAAVHYPWLASHRHHDLATKQMSGGGGVLSFETYSPEVARSVCESTTIFALAVSLGATESLIEYPAAMTHAAKAGAESAIPANLVRLAVGLEDPDDLIADLDCALGA